MPPIKTRLFKRFSMRDLGPVSKCFGLRVTRDRNKRIITLDQEQYARSILKNFFMEDCEACPTPMEEGTNGTLLKTEGVDERYPYRNLIGSLMYLYQGTRPDLSFAINTLSRFNTSYKQEHWRAAKRVLRYLKGTMKYKLRFGPEYSDIVGYSDAGFPKTPIDDPRSVSGHLFMSCGGPILWSTHRPATFAISSTEAEYMALMSATREAISIHHFCNELYLRENKPINLKCDKKSALYLALKANFSRESCHINTYHHFIKKTASDKMVDPQFVKTANMIADGLTKALSKNKFKNFLKAMNFITDHELKQL